MRQQPAAIRTILRKFGLPHLQNKGCVRNKATWGHSCAKPQPGFQPTMFMQPGPLASGNPMMRPAFLVTVLMVMFLTMHTDWSSRQPSQVEILAAVAPAAAPLGEVNRHVHQQVLLPISLACLLDIRGKLTLQCKSLLR